MIRLRTLALAALAVVGSASLAEAQITPLNNTIQLFAAKQEVFSVAVDNASFTPGTSGARRADVSGWVGFGQLTLTPSWDLKNNRNIQIYIVGDGMTPVTAGNPTLPATGFEATYTVAGGASTTANFAGNIDATGKNGIMFINGATGPSGLARQVTGATQRIIISNLRFDFRTATPDDYNGSITLVGKVS
jgi:hypothetical protein